MENFKLASKLKLRFQSPKGMLSTEQLWDLSLPELDAMAVALEKEHKLSAKKSFLVKSTAKDKVVKIKFDLVLDVLNTRVEEQADAMDALEKKEHNQKILSLISEKKDDQLKSLSVEQLEKMIR